MISNQLSWITLLLAPAAGFKGARPAGPEAPAGPQAPERLWRWNCAKGQDAGVGVRQAGLRVVVGIGLERGVSGARSDGYSSACELVSFIARIGFTHGLGRSKAGVDDARGRISGRQPLVYHPKMGR